MGIRGEWLSSKSVDLDMRLQFQLRAAHDLDIVAEFDQVVALFGLGYAVNNYDTESLDSRLGTAI
jgi:hypothetical protein